MCAIIGSAYEPVTHVTQRDALTFWQCRLRHTSSAAEVPLPRHSACASELPGAQEFQVRLRKSRDLVELHYFCFAIYRREVVLTGCCQGAFIRFF